MEKISQRFIDNIGGLASKSGVVVLKKVECVDSVGKNDCEHVEQCNIARIAAFIKHYSYIALLMGH